MPYAAARKPRCRLNRPFGPNASSRTAECRPSAQTTRPNRLRAPCPNWTVTPPSSWSMAAMLSPKMVSTCPLEAPIDRGSEVGPHDAEIAIAQDAAEHAGVEAADLASRSVDKAPFVNVV